MRANRAGGSVSISSSLATRVTHTGRDRASGDEPTRSGGGVRWGELRPGGSGRFVWLLLGTGVTGRTLAGCCLALHLPVAEFVTVLCSPSTCCCLFAPRIWFSTIVLLFSFCIGYT
jgi:hypothetical protein